MLKIHNEVKHQFLIKKEKVQVSITLMILKLLLNTQMTQTIFKKILNNIRDEKLQYDIYRETAKISALSSGKIDKYEYLTGEVILPSNQTHIIEHAKFAYSTLGEAFEKQTKKVSKLF